MRAGYSLRPRESERAGAACWVAWPLWAGLHQAAQSSPSLTIPAPLGWGWWEAQAPPECVESGEGCGRESPPGAKSSRPCPDGLGAASSSKLAQDPGGCACSSRFSGSCLRGFCPIRTEGARKDLRLQAQPEHTRPPGPSPLLSETGPAQGQGEDSRTHLELQRRV